MSLLMSLCMHMYEHVNDMTWPADSVMDVWECKQVDQDGKQHLTSLIKRHLRSCMLT